MLLKHFICQRGTNVKRVEWLSVWIWAGWIRLFGLTRITWLHVFKLELEAKTWIETSSLVVSLPAMSQIVVSSPLLVVGSLLEQVEWRKTHMVILTILFKVLLLWHHLVFIRRSSHGRECQLVQTSIRQSWAMRVILAWSQTASSESDQFLKFKNTVQSFSRTLNLESSSWKKCQSKLFTHLLSACLITFNFSLAKPSSPQRKAKESKSLTR